MDDRYLMGSCHHLAVAMHRLTGWDLAIVAGPYQGEGAVYHVFCVAPDGTAWDARGPTSVGDLVGEQESMDGGEAWPIRLADEAEVWSLAHHGKLHSIHQTHVLGAIETVEEILDGKAEFVSDGWKPRDPAAVAEAAEGRRPQPNIDRDAAFDPDGASAPGPR